MSKPFGTYDYWTPRVRKVKHVKFFTQYSAYDGTIDTDLLEHTINKFADDNPEFKILSIRIDNFGDPLIATVTYLQKVEGATAMEDYDGADEEADID